MNQCRACRERRGECQAPVAGQDPSGFGADFDRFYRDAFKGDQAAAQHGGDFHRGARQFLGNQGFKSGLIGLGEIEDEIGRGVLWEAACQFVDEA